LSCDRKSAIGRSIALALVVATAFATQTTADGLPSACRSLLDRYVFNCDCTTEFLEDNLSPEHAEIMLKLWTLAVRSGAMGDRGQDARLQNIYLQHGRATVDEAVMSFHRHRDRLRIYCSEGDAPVIAD
jgi:hypothetical protein